MSTRRLVVGLTTFGLITFGLIGTSCSSKDPDGLPSGSTPPLSTTPSPTARAAAEREAVAAYVGMWQAMAKAGEIPDPDAPELRQYAADKALARIVSVLVTYRETDVVTRGAPITHARASDANPADVPTEVTVADCGDSTRWTKHKKSTGELIKDDPRGRRNITAVVKHHDGRWKVVSFDVGDIGSC